MGVDQLPSLFRAVLPHIKKLLDGHEGVIDIIPGHSSSSELEPPQQNGCASSESLSLSSSSSSTPFSLSFFLPEVFELPDISSVFFLLDLGLISICASVCVSLRTFLIDLYCFLCIFVDISSVFEID